MPAVVTATQETRMFNTLMEVLSAEKPLCAWLTPPIAAKRPEYKHTVASRHAGPHGNPNPEADWFHGSTPFSTPNLSIAFAEAHSPTDSTLLSHVRVGVDIMSILGLHLKEVLRLPNRRLVST